VFHQLCTQTVGTAEPVYYITFQAKAKEVPSNNPVITTFQTEVWDSKDTPAEVKECAIKI